MRILAIPTVKVLLPMMMTLMRMILVIVLILLVSLIFGHCLLPRLLLVVLIFVIEYVLLFFKNFGHRNDLLNLLELMKVLLQGRVVMIILVVLVIASLEGPDEVIIILIAVLLLPSMPLFLVTAPPMVVILLGVLGLLVVRELVFVGLARVVVPIIVVVAAELIETLLIKEESIEVIEPLVVRQYVEAHLIIVATLDLLHLAHCVCRLLFALLLLLSLTAGLSLGVFVCTRSLVFLLATREVDFDLLRLILFVFIPLLFSLSGLWLSLSLLGLFLSGLLLLDIFRLVFHLIYNRITGGR